MRNFNNTISYDVNENGYIIYENNKKVVMESGPDFPYGGDTAEEACINHIKAVFEDKETLLEEVLAEVLLGQAEIIANQTAQDEVLAEVLLNSLEV